VGTRLTVVLHVRREEERSQEERSCPSFAFSFAFRSLLSWRGGPSSAYICTSFFPPALVLAFSFSRPRSHLSIALMLASFFLDSYSRVSRFLPFFTHTHTAEEEQYHCLTYTQSSLACTISWALTLTSPWDRGGEMCGCTGSNTPIAQGHPSC